MVNQHNQPLTPTQEDYLEIIFRLNQAGNPAVTITDLAQGLGCQLPTVTRTIKTLTEHGYVTHKPRESIQLSEHGTTLAQQVAHRHDDTEAFLHTVLCLDTDTATADACKIEHGLSPIAAQRLHAFMKCFAALPSEIQTHIQDAVQSIDKHAPLFDQIQPHETSRWRHS
jgi:DtxR family Mn-dependent transcriptional regulator